MSEAAATNAAAPFESFAALHREHGELRRWFGKAKAGAEREGAAEKVREFLRRAAATGVTLSEPGERNGAQAILDYWCSELVGLPNPQPSDFKRVRLAEPSATLQAAGAAKAANAKPDPESREVIRLAATARLWRDSGMKGFLLTGGALDHAAKFRGVDDDIDKLVRASKKARRKIWTVSTAAALASVAAVLLVLFVLVPDLSNRAIATIQDRALRGSESARVRSNRLRQLEVYQLVRPPFDLSADDVVLDRVKVPGLKLSAPNFSRLAFNSVDLHDAELASASFSNTRITGPSNFERAKLSLAQFREASIVETSFAGAELYRAIFDRACLSDVNFAGANLRHASFWGVSFDSRFAFDRSFRDSPWWLADGWNSSQIAALSAAKQSGLRSSIGFEEHLDPAREALENAAAGSLEWGIAANELAWRLAIWGIIPPSSAPAPAPSLEQTCSRARELAAPEQAVDAAEQAVCIAYRLHESKAALANLQDTRAYVLLQSGRAEEAAEIYRKEVAPFLDSGGVLFRAAVAHQAIGDGEAALDFLNRSIKKQYVPTHEMYTLKRYIKETFQEAVYKQIDRSHPSIPRPASCQAED